MMYAVASVRMSMNDYESEWYVDNDHQPVQQLRYSQSAQSPPLRGGRNGRGGRSVSRGRGGAGCNGGRQQQPRNQMQWYGNPETPPQYQSAYPVSNHDGSGTSTEGNAAAMEFIRKAQHGMVPIPVAGAGSLTEYAQLCSLFT